MRLFSPKGANLITLQTRRMLSEFALRNRSFCYNPMKKTVVNFSSAAVVQIRLPRASWHKRLRLSETCILAWLGRMPASRAPSENMDSSIFCAGRLLREYSTFMIRFPAKKPWPPRPEQCTVTVCSVFLQAALLHGSFHGCM